MTGDKVIGKGAHILLTLLENRYRLIKINIVSGMKLKEKL